ncbi:MAG: hypothetical protein WC623_23390 [Pedobacter sp.]|uniref:hypothetical protein n=1 Tax=Pedobacter sp. TaxID=1411316 RepID=UPI003565A204
MNKPEDVTITYIPHNFNVACTIFNLSIQRFLQQFIDHVSFYDMIFPTEVDAYELATRTLSKYSYDKKETPDDQKNYGMIATTDLEGSVQAVKGMHMISLQTGLNNKQRREKAEKLVQKLFFHIGKDKVKSKTLYLGKDQTLTLSPDFCLICEIQQIGPVEHLTNLMENISLADMEARTSLGMSLENPAMGFYMKGHKIYNDLRSNEAVHPLTFNYIDDLQELRLHLFIYRSLKLRVQKHQELLDKYFNLITNKL